MVVSFDVDGVLVDSPYVDSNNVEAMKKWIDNIRTYPLRFPEALHDIRRWQSRGHRVVAVSSRRPSLQEVTGDTLRRLNLDRVICAGELKEDVLLWMNPIVHFDDNPKYTNGSNRVRVWAPSWGNNVDGLIGTWKEIREAVDKRLEGRMS